MSGTPISLELNVIFEPILSYDRARDVVLVTGGAGMLESKLTTWDLTKRLEQETLKLPGSLRDAQFLGGSRMAIVHANGCLMVVRLAKP